MRTELRQLATDVSRMPTGLHVYLFGISLIGFAGAVTFLATDIDGVGFWTSLAYLVWSLGCLGWVVRKH